MKVRGFRIEPGEVETSLCGHRDVAGAIVAAHDYGDGDVRLAAYVIPAAGVDRGYSAEEKLMAELSAKAAEELPLHMRPSSYLIVDQIPLTAHGKTDREALKELALRSHALRGDGPAGPAAAGGDATEQAVVRIWEEILQRPGIGPRDDFFDLGGTSLALIRIFAQVNRQFGVSLNGSVLVEEPTAARLAQCIDEALGRHSPATRELTATEQVVVGIWEDILQRRGIGVRDDFFDLGGTSLALIRIFARVNQHFEVSLNGSVLVDDPTAAQLARCVDSELKGRPSHETVLEKK
jgi:syringomycin synthetase protein SyrB1